MIEFEEHRPPAPPEAPDDTERRLAARDHRIPHSYRPFLAERDGGRPVKDTFYFEPRDRPQSSSVSSFLGVQPRPEGSLTSDLASVVEVVGDIPPGIPPIADDEVGQSHLHRHARRPRRPGAVLGPRRGLRRRRGRLQRRCRSPVDTATWAASSSTATA
jgi:hypothetical protein